jgi:localization factor PodJL
VSNGAAPWSIKGIDPKAREAAREAARRRGLTIGEWLNQAILANEAALSAVRPASGGVDSALVDALEQLAERVDSNDRRAGLAMGAMDRSLAAIGQRLEAASLAASGSGHVDGLLAELREAQAGLLQKMRTIEEDDKRAASRMGAVEQTVSQLAAQVTGAEADTGQKLRALESSLASLDEKMAQAGAGADLDSNIEARFAAIAETLNEQVEDVRAGYASAIAAAMGDLKPDETRVALNDLSKRIAASERRHAQTIEAVSIEIKRLNEAMERRLRGIEARNDDGAAAQDRLREQMNDMASSVDHRLAQTEERFSGEIGRMAERFEQRIETSEVHAANAISQVGEQVSIVAERLQDEHHRLAADLSVRLSDNEERQASHLEGAIDNLSAYLDRIESKASGASPVMDGAIAKFAERLAAIEARLGGAPKEQAPTTQETPAVKTAPVSPDLNEADATEPPQAQQDQDMDLSFHPADRHGQIITDEETLAHHHAALREMSDHLHQRGQVLSDDPSNDTIFVEDIAARFGRHTADPFGEAETMPPPADPYAEAAVREEYDDDLWATGRAEDAPLAPLSETLGYEDEPAEDLDNFAEDQSEFARYEEQTSDADNLMFDAEGPEPKGVDYLSQARQAAKANVLDAKAARATATAKSDLRGPTRLIVWTAATAVLAAAAGGAYLLSHGADEGPKTSNRNTLTPPPPGSIAEAAERTEKTEPAAAPAPAEPPPSTTGSDAEPAPVRAGPVTPFAWNAPSVGTITEAVAMGDPVAEFDVAMQRMTDGDAAGSAVLLKKAAEKGLAVAQYRLAKLYEHGQGVPQDLAQARALTEQAARAGNASAMHDLGVYLANAEGSKLDEESAFTWFRKAAEFGVQDSQYNVGLLYQQGRGVAPDANQAYYWFSVAAAAGDKAAAAHAAMLEHDLGAKQADSLLEAAQNFQARRGDRFANGDFGARPWAPSTTLQASASSTPQT